MRTSPRVILLVLACALCLLGRSPAAAQVTYSEETPIDAVGYVRADETNWVEASGASVVVHVWEAQTVEFKIASETSPDECVSDIDSSNDPYYLGDTLDWEWDFGDQTSTNGDSTPIQFPWNQFRLQPPTPAMYEWEPAEVPSGHMYTAPGTYVAAWSVSDRFTYRGAEQPDANDDDLSGSITIVVHSLDRGLPTQNLNSGAGANRCNIRWANSDYNTEYHSFYKVGYGDDFTMPTGSDWVIDTIVVWAVPSIPIEPLYYLGDHFQSVSLYTGGTTGTLTLRAGGTLQVGSDGVTPTLGDSIGTSSVYYTGSTSYETATGLSNKIWQISFSHLDWEVAAGTTCFFGVHGVPRVDRLWLNHAVNCSLAGFDGLGDGKIRRFEPDNLTAGSTLVDAKSWFDGKGSDISVRVYAHSVQ